MSKEEVMRGHWARAFLAFLAVVIVIPLGGCPPPPNARFRVRTGPTPVVTTPAPAPAPTVVSGNVLSPGGAVASGTIAYPGHRVRYPFAISYPRTVNIYVNGAGLDPTVAVYNAYGSQIGFNDDGGSGLDSHLVLTLAPGDYFIEVAGFSSSTGPYTVTIQ
jgi:hypothetical protein